MLLAPQEQRDRQALPAPVDRAAQEAVGDPAEAEARVGRADQVVVAEAEDQEVQEAAAVPVGRADQVVVAEVEVQEAAVDLEEVEVPVARIIRITLPEIHRVVRVLGPRHSHQRDLPRDPRLGPLHSLPEFPHLDPPHDLQESHQLDLQFSLQEFPHHDLRHCPRAVLQELLLEYHRGSPRELPRSNHPKHLQRDRQKLLPDDLRDGHPGDLLPLRLRLVLRVHLQIHVSDIAQ